MKNIKILFISFVLLSLLGFFTGCRSKSVESFPANASKLSSEASGYDSSKMEKIAEKHKYEISKDPDIKYLYLIIPDGEDIKIEKYELKNKESTELIVQKNKDFILSFPGNRNLNYTWTIDNQIDESFIKLNEKSWSRPSFLSFINMNSNKDRYKLNFHVLRSGRQAVEISYSNPKIKDSSQFEATLIISGK
jgi:hypothetical protein